MQVHQQLEAALKMGAIGPFLNLEFDRRQQGTFEHREPDMLD